MTGLSPMIFMRKSMVVGFLMKQTILVGGGATLTNRLVRDLHDICG